MLMHEKLVSLGWVYYNDRIHIIEPETNLNIEFTQPKELDLEREDSS